MEEQLDRRQKINIATKRAFLQDLQQMLHELHALVRLFKKDLRNNSRCFDGAMVLLSGDFRQTLSVIPRSTGEINACLKASKKLQLSVNMRVALLNDIPADDCEAIADYR